jgi:hypothetical protein
MLFISHINLFSSAKFLFIINNKITKYINIYVSVLQIGLDNDKITKSLYPISNTRNL